jgi:DnaJ-class molecular chaperone
MAVHPDKNKSAKAAEAMGRVTKAYQALSETRIGRPANA